MLTIPAYQLIVVKHIIKLLVNRQTLKIHVIMKTAELVPYLEDASRRAGARIMEVYTKGPKAEFKQDGSPVTIADRAAEKLILEVIAEVWPEIPVISEENSASHIMTPPDCFFLVDPLDGTKEFLKHDGEGTFTVNIALIEKGEPILGVVFAPLLDRLFTGVKGIEAREQANGKVKTIKVREVPSIGALAVTSCSQRDEFTIQWLEDHGIANTISIGSSLKFCLVACGEADVYPRFSPTMEWDTAAGDAILRAAGGSVTHPDGSLYKYGKKDYRNTAFIAWGLMQNKFAS